MTRKIATERLKWGGAPAPPPLQLPALPCPSSGGPTLRSWQIQMWSHLPHEKRSLFQTLLISTERAVRQGEAGRSCWPGCCVSCLFSLCVYLLERLLNANYKKEVTRTIFISSFNKCCLQGPDSEFCFNYSCHFNTKRLVSAITGTESKSKDGSGSRTQKSSSSGWETFICHD